MGQEAETSFHLVKTRTKEAAQAMIAAAEHELSATEDRLDGWNDLQDVVGNRFNGMHRANLYLGNLAHILSVPDYWQKYGRVEIEVQDVQMGKSGLAFLETAQTVFYLREKQLEERLGLERDDPVRLPGYNHLTKRMWRRGTTDMVEFGTKLKAASTRRLNRPGYWAKPLADYLWPLADTSRVRSEEVGLGVNIGLMLINSAYRGAEDRSQTNQAAQHSVDQTFKALKPGFKSPRSTIFNKIKQNNREDDQT